MATFGHGRKRDLVAGTVLSPNTPIFPLKPFITDVSGDESIDQEEQTTLSAQDHGASKSFLYGNNGETGQLSVQWDKEGDLINWFADVKAQGVEDEDFNVMIHDYPFGNVSGAWYFARPIKLSGRSIAGGSAAKIAGNISFQRSGELQILQVP